MIDVSCRTCGSTRIRRVGVLPDADVFAGRTLSAKLPGGSLWQCLDCDFGFRSPLLGEGRYADLYREGSLDVWDAAQKRTDFDLIRERLGSSFSGRVRVVDIGCYTGQFLSSLPENFVRFGVEPGLGAAEIAASRGVTIVSRTIEEFASTEEFYEIIVACDVIEHVANPLDFLQKLARRLTPSGRLFVTTGNYDSRLWKLTGAKFWYCYFPEHISFIGPRWIRRFDAELGLKVCEIVRFNYLGGGFNFKQSIAALLFARNRPFYRWIRSRTVRLEGTESPPGCAATRDHMLCTFQRE